MLKLNQQTVRNWIDQGSLPALRVGRRVRIKRSDFERVLEQSYSASAGSAPADRGPSPEDFWGGTPVGVAEPDPLAPDSDGESTADGARAATGVAEPDPLAPASDGESTADGARAT